MAIPGYPIYLENARPNTFRGEINLEAAICGGMSRNNPDELDNFAIAHRMRILRFFASIGFDNCGSEMRTVV